MLYTYFSFLKIISYRINYLILINTSRRRNSVAQPITEKAKFLNLVIANESKRLILNATNTLTRGALTIVEFWMNTVTIKGQITSIPIPPITRYNRTSPVVANSANIAKSASLPSIDANTVTSNWQLQCRVKSTYFSIISPIPNICFCL